MAILDAGPLISVWNKDEHALWATALFAKYQGPFYTTELVLCEVAHMTERDAEIAQMVREKRFLIGASLWEHSTQMERCLAAFAHCDLADASIIVTSETKPRLNILTTDRRHFVTYRRADSSPLPLELPPLD